MPLRRYNINATKADTTKITPDTSIIFSEFKSKVLDGLSDDGLSDISEGLGVRIGVGVGVGVGGGV